MSNPIIYDAINVTKKTIDVIYENLARASDPNYHAREVDLVSMDTCDIGGIQVGRGVRIGNITRKEASYAEKAYLESVAKENFHKNRVNFLQEVDRVLGVQSANADTLGLQRSLENWHAAWSGSDGVINKSQLFISTRDLFNNLTAFNNNFEELLAKLGNDYKDSINSINDTANRLAVKFSELNNYKGTIIGRDHQVKDDISALLKELAQYGAVSVRTISDKGDYAVYLEDYQLIDTTRVNELDVNRNADGSYSPRDLSGRILDDFTSGSFGSIQKNQTTLIELKEQCNTYLNTFFDKVNLLYSNADGAEPVQELYSKLGYSILGSNGVANTLSFLPEGELCPLSFSLYDDNNELLTTRTIFLQSSDTLNDLTNKITSIPGLNASWVNTNETQGLLAIRMDSSTAPAGATSFSIFQNAVEDHLTRFSTRFFTENDWKFKTKNDPLTAEIPTITTVSLESLKTDQNASSVDELRNTSLYLDESFVLSLFETATETNNLVNGHHVAQIKIPIVPEDSLDMIMNKISTLGASIGIQATWDATTTTYSITCNQTTDATGTLGQGTNVLRLAFGNFYKDEDIRDRRPNNYSPLGDPKGIISHFQCNSLIHGNQLGDYTLNPSIKSNTQLRTGYTRELGDDSLSAEIAALFSVKLDDEGHTIYKVLEKLKLDNGQTILQENEMFKSFTENSVYFSNRIGAVSGVNYQNTIAQLLETMMLEQSLANLARQMQENIKTVISLLS